MEKKVKNNNSADVGKRINDTKRDIAQLNEELQRLINSNMNRNEPQNELKKSQVVKKGPIDSEYSDKNGKTNLTSLTTKASNVKQHISQKINTTVSTKENNLKIEPLCNKRVKSYSKEATKEYIKQQREKREELRKQVDSKTKIELETKKQKLYELQQKSLALVQRNIQMKRERSKSRENRGQIRIDKTFSPPRKDNLDDKKKHACKIDIDGNSKTQNPMLHNDLKLSEEAPLRVNSKSANRAPNISLPRSKDRFIGYSTRRDHVFTEKKYLTQPPSRNITFRRENSPGNKSPASQRNRSLAATKIQALYRGYRVRKQLKSEEKIISDQDMANENSIKESKETQTSFQHRVKTPDWLQVPSLDPYPCNFINTVKRKLQIVVNSPITSRDIGVQSSVVDSKRSYVKGRTVIMNENTYEKELSKTKTPEEYPNLDVEPLQHLALVHREKESEENLSGYLKSDSECDTSKNIPEISTESGLASLVNEKASFNWVGNNNFLHINCDRIKNLHLENPLDRNQNSDTNNKNADTLRYQNDVVASISKKSCTFNYKDSVTDNVNNVHDEICSNRSEDEITSKTPHNSIFSFIKNGHNDRELTNKKLKNHFLQHDEILGSQIDSKRCFSRTDNNARIECITPVKCDESTEAKKETTHEEKFVSSPRDSIVSFNTSDEPVQSYSANFQEDSRYSTDEISTENSDHSSLNSKNKHSIKENNGSASSAKKLHSSNYKEKMITTRLKPKLNTEISQVSLIKTIEDSINTSLVSHISEKTVSRNFSDHTSKVNERTKTSLQEPPFSKTLKKKNLNGEHILNIMGNNKNEDPNFEHNLLCSTHSQHKNRSQTGSQNKQTLSDIEYAPSISNSYGNTIASEISLQRSDNSANRNGSNTSDFVSLYSSNFSSEKASSSIAKNSQQMAPICRDEKMNNKKLTNLGKKDNLDDFNGKKIIENNTSFVKDINNKVIHAKVDTDINQIHLKFEAEVHLLNDFNESLKQLMAVEKAFETIKNKNESSFRNTSKNSTILTMNGESKFSTELSRSILSTINTSRGSFIDDSQDSLRKCSKTKEEFSELEIINYGESLDNTFENSVSNVRIPNNLAGLSIKMFEQLIRDEDVRIENLKTIIKIREQALLDRTKGELAWLEIQRKHLKETGRIQEASLVKKKQRGILLKHQQERREMQRLKQLQKLQSNERKTILKEQRNLIKAKLTSEKKMSDLKIHTPKKQKPSGPMKVFKSSESIHSETSISRKASDNEEVINITSKTHPIRLSEAVPSSEMVLNEKQMKTIENTKDISNLKRALLTRQAALTKRRKAVEDLLQRHQKLLEEEKKINELEMAANALIMQMPTVHSKPSTPKLKMKGQQLNELGQKIGGLFKENKFLDDKTYSLSQSLFEKLQAKAENYLHTHKNQQLATSYNSIPLENILDLNNQRKNETDTCNVYTDSKSHNYSEDFDAESHNIDNFVAPPTVDESNISSISELIEDFSRIEEGITMLSQQSDISTPAESHSSYVCVDSQKTSVIETKLASPTTETSSAIKDNSLIHSEKLEEAEKSELKIPISHGILVSKEDTLLPNEDSPDLTESSEEKSPEKLDLPESGTCDTFLGIGDVFNTPKITGSRVSEELSSIPQNVIDVNSRASIKSIVFDGENQSEEISPSDRSSYSKQNIEEKIENNDLEKEMPLLSIKSTSELISDIPTDRSSLHSVSMSTREVNDLNKIEDNSVEVRELSDHTGEPITSHKIDLKLQKQTTAIEQQKGTDNTSSIIKTISHSDLDLKSSLNDGDDIEESTSLEENNSLNLKESHTSSNYIEKKVSDNDNSLNIINSTQLSVISNGYIIDEEYDGVSKLFMSELHSETEKVNNVTGCIETDVSEAISTDKNHPLNVIDYIQDSSSDNYSDDFEDDKDDEIESDAKSPYPISTSINDESHSGDIHRKESDENAIVMVQIDISPFESPNEAKIIVVNKDDVSNTQIPCDDSTVKRQIPHKNEIDNQDDQIVETCSESQINKYNSTYEKLGSQVEQRASEIFANTDDSEKNLKEKTVNYLDYISTFEDVTPTGSPDSGSAVKSPPQTTTISTFGYEAEELLRKQLAIEQEIKHLEQQQKEEVPFVYVREIPNKPPPPYTPPSSISNTVSTILPLKVEDLHEICNYSAKVLYNAYLSNNLNGVTFSETHFKSINETKSTKECCLFIFDLCREVAKSHYERFEKENVPSWLKLPEGSRLTYGKPFDYRQLEKHINKKVKEFLGFEKPNIQENSVIKWSRKKKDHVDEILILEFQAQEHEWLDYDKDELMVKNEVTNEIFDILLKDTIEVFKTIFP